MTTTNTQTFPRLNCDTSNRASVRACFPNGEAMVYGFARCHYMEVIRAFRQENIKIYGSKLGVNVPNRPGDKSPIQFMGRQIYQINSGQKEENTNVEPSVTRVCKDGLVNMVLENYKEQRKGLPLVPIVFCIATSKYPLNVNNVVSKTIINPINFSHPPNKVITHSELRRAYKLCHDVNISPEIRDVANKSFKFVQVTPAGNFEQTYDFDFQLNEIEAPWKSPEWDAAWHVRKNSSTPRPGKQYNWRKEVNDFVRRHNWDAPYRPLFSSKI